MQLTSVELWQRITQLGLASPADCRRWAAAAAKSLDAADASDGVKLLRQLLRQGQITKYQAQILAGQAHGPVRQGDWVIREPVPDRLWPNWFAVVPATHDTSMETSPKWARWLSTSDLHRLRSVGPQLQRSARLLRIRHDNLQAVERLETVAGKLEIVVAPITGQSLLEAARETQDAHKITVMIRGLADGLAALHAAHIVHGRVLPDRIYLEQDRARLACDPLCMHTSMPDHPVPGLLATQLGNFHTAQFIAPEFLAPGQLPTPATDVYSLGCVWWWWLIGSPPNPGQDTSQAMAGHAQPAPSLPPTSQLAPPLERCLYHAVAKNPDARFLDAIAMCAALDAALEEQIVASESDKSGLRATPAVLRPSAPGPAVSPGLASPRPSQGSSAASPTASAATTSTAAMSGSRLGGSAGNVRTGPAPAERTQSTANPVSVATAREAMEARRARQRRKYRWLVPTLSGCGFLITTLLILKFSGALEPGPVPDARQSSPSSARRPPPTPPEPQPSDPRDEFYNIVADDTGALWVPPHEPSPLPLELLPPGGQLFMCWHPAEMLKSSLQRGWLNAFDVQLAGYLANLSGVAGQPLENIRQVTLSGYSPSLPNGEPQIAMRIELVTPKPLNELQAAWDAGGQEVVDGQTLLIAADGWLYYVPEQPLVASQSVAVYSAGPLELMREAAQMHGAATPLVPPMEKLWQHTSQQMDFSLLYSPAYLLGDGRWFVQQHPQLLQQVLRQLLGVDRRAGLLQMDLEPRWYVEMQWIGASDRGAGSIARELEEQLSSLPADVERWLVVETPHAAWRALALRFPQMLQVLQRHTRFGVEGGVAIANLYLPSEAAVNLLLAGWWAVQDEAAQPAPATAAAEPRSLSISDYLGLPLHISFEQEPIEAALKLVGEEANDALPDGVTGWRFELDGDAFEKAGITRNQQLRDFHFDRTTLREALTEIARRGNPVTTVTDTRQADQKLIWVVLPDPSQPATQVVSLTTRAAATAAGIDLPREFGGENY